MHGRFAGEVALKEWPDPASAKSGVKMRLLRDAEEGDRKGYAVLCVLFSLPFHYVLWVSVFEIVRDRPSVSMTTGLVIAGMGLVAIALNYFALALYRFKSNNRVLQLPSVVLSLASVILAANAIFQFTTLHVLEGIGSLAVSIGAFCIVLRRRRGRNS